MPSSVTPKPSIHERMAAILAGLPAIGKDSYNQGLKFNFRSVETILNEINPLLEKHGVYLLPEVRDLQVDTRPTKNGQAAVAIVTVAYHFVAEDGAEVVAVSVGEGQDSGDKSVSKAMTMALKTCLGQTFAIATEDDPDGDTQPSIGQATPTASPEESREEAAGTGTGAPAAPSGDEPKWQKALDIVKAYLHDDDEAAATKKAQEFRAWLAEEKIPNDFPKMSDAQLNTVLAKVDPL